MAATGFEISVELPSAPRRPLGLLADALTPTTFTDAELKGNPNRWILGATFVPWGCSDLSAGPNDCDPESYSATGFPTEVTQPSFLLWDALQCTTLSGVGDIMDGRIVTRLRDLASAAVASELLSGTASGGDGLADVATSPTDVPFGWPALSPVDALTVIEEELADRLHGLQGMIHVTPGLLHRLTVLGGVVRDDQLWYTPTGHVVVADAGYVGAPAPTGEGAAAVGEAWIYASGPVFYTSDDPELLGADNQEVVNMDRNIRRRFGLSHGLLLFEPCPVTAVLVNLGIYGIGGS